MCPTVDSFLAFSRHTFLFFLPGRSQRGHRDPVQFKLKHGAGVSHDSSDATPHVPTSGEDLCVFNILKIKSCWLSHFWGMNPQLLQLVSLLSTLCPHWLRLVSSSFKGVVSHFGEICVFLPKHWYRSHVCTLNFKLPRAKKGKTQPPAPLKLTHQHVTRLFDLKTARRRRHFSVGSRCPATSWESRK